MTDPEELLRDALTHHADHTPYDATPLREVETGARRLRRRRRTLAAGLAAAAAVVVAVVPLAVVASRDDAAEPQPAPSTTPTTPATPTPTPTPAPTTDPSAPAGELGDPPLIAYATGREILEPEDRVFVLPRGLGVSGFAAYRGGYLVADTRFFEGTTGLTRYDADGREVASWTTSGVPVANADRSLVAWTTFAPPESGVAAPTLVHRGAATGGGPEQTQELDLATPSVVGLLGDEVVVQAGFAEGVWATDLASEPRRIDTLDRATDVSEAQGLVSGSIEDDTLARVVDAATGAVLWERRGVTVGAFSPDGRLAVTTRTSGGVREIVDARTGEVVATVESSGEDVFPTLLELTWEDDRHLLGDLVLNCCTHLARVDLDGGLSMAARGGIGGTGFVFAKTS